jgi:hypothetical protein
MKSPLDSRFMVKIRRIPILPRGFSLSYRGRRQISYADVRRSSKPWFVVRRKGRSPLTVVAGAHFKTKEEAQKEADDLNRSYEGSDVRFMVREEGFDYHLQQTIKFRVID